jgi:(p)ppGpp synthase/HD superfamily hydrolase
METLHPISKNEFLSFLEEGNVRIDPFVEGAIEIAEQVHAGLQREDRKSAFLETHTWPVTIDVVRHFRSAQRNITSVEIASAILHDIMEDDERILDLYHSKSYGFDAYIAYRFGNKIRDLAIGLKIPPIDNYDGTTSSEKELNRFRAYCDILLEADYDVKVIKLADRLNNMTFIRNIPGHAKIRRYIREAEDFYLAYAMIAPKMPDYYSRMRAAYEELRSPKLVAT